jgi:hypothetical protein
MAVKAESSLQIIAYMFWGASVMRFEVGQIWRSSVDGTVRAKVITVTDDGSHATLRRITHGMGTFELDIAAILTGLQKWQLVARFKE